MSNKISDVLRTIAGNFSILADELEQSEDLTNQRLSNIEQQVAISNETLKDAARMILSKLDQN